MTTTTDSDFSGQSTHLENPQVNKLDELEQKLKKVATCIKTLEMTHHSVEITFDQIERQLRGFPAIGKKVRQYIIIVHQHVSQLDQRKKTRSNNPENFRIAVISFFLAILIVMLLSLCKSGSQAQSLPLASCLLPDLTVNFNFFHLLINYF